MNLKTLNHHLKEKKRFTDRVIVAVILCAVFVMLLIGRLVYLQVVEHARYMSLSNKNQLSVIQIKPERGLIYDRNGILLAGNLPVHNLSIVQAYAGNTEKVIQRLSEIIEISPEEKKLFKKTAGRSFRFEPVVLKQKLTELEMAKFYVNQHQFPGVMVDTQFVRHYPEGEVFAHALGYVGRVNQADLKKNTGKFYGASDYIGKVGLEKYYESELRGTPGYQEVEVDAIGRVVRAIKTVEPISGETLHLGIDSGLQKEAVAAFEDNQGALVALDPKTGEILAFVSRPGYDANMFVTGISKESFNALNQSKKRPFYNRAIQGQYSPGSTIKPFLALGALDEGFATPEETINDKGFFQVPGSQKIVHDHKRDGHGKVDLAKAIIVSCDIYFYQLAVKMKVAKLNAFLKKFGLGSATGLDVGGELSGLVPGPNWKKKKKNESWFPGDTVNSGIGQGYVLSTPAQLAVATSMLANKGKVYRPHFLAQKKLPNGKKIEVDPVLEKQWVLKNPEHWGVVLDAMEGVAHSAHPKGSVFGYFGAHSPYRVAAKTGTVEVWRPKKYDFVLDKLRPKKYRNHKWLIVYAPAEKPKIALAVVTEHDSTAPKIAKKVLDYYLLEKMSAGKKTSEG